MPQQGTHHFVLTIQRPTVNGFAVATYHGDVTPGPSATRMDLFNYLQAEHARHYPDTANGVVLYFSLEPNQL
ncbi:hypothetical protein [Streptomyces albus]|uniref:hypothetical protein n=1 Tax=Streptomyces albus TaxID=1888 RepID=UPI000567429F|nr:hypothetical protein [Streptomyces albus]